jgi:hypothetical protein
MKHLHSRRGARAAGLLLIMLLVLGSPVGVPAAARAQVVPDPPTLEVREVGWEGLVLNGAWMPIRVRVVGGRTAVEGRIEAVSRSASNGPAVAYSQELFLPAGATKELVLWAATASMTSGLVRLTAGDQVLAEEAITTAMYRGTSWPGFGVLADGPAIAQRLRQLEVRGPSGAAQAGVANLRAADLPTVGERLNALGGLVVQGNAAASLSAEQRRAVRDWVAAGNHLVLAGALRAPRANAVLPDGVLPVTPLGVDPLVDLSELAAWAEYPRPPGGPGPVARYRAEGEPLVGTAERALVRRFELGRGTITLLAVDLDLEPLASWDGTPALLQKVFEPALPSPGDNARQRTARLAERDLAVRLQQPVEALPPDVYPSWQMVLLILGGFTLVVGPLLHLALARADRRGWLWLAVPGGAVVLSGALYHVGIGREGRDVLGNVVSYVRLEPEHGVSRQYLAGGFFAPTHARLQVSVPGDTPVRVGGSWNDPSRLPPRGPAGAAPAAPVVRVDQGIETRVAFASNQWMMRTVILERSLGPELGRISARLERSMGTGNGGAVLKGSVRNDTPYVLEDAAVLIGDSLNRLGTLAPGESAEVDLTVTAASRSPRVATEWAWRLLAGPPNQAGAPPGIEPVRGAESERRARLLTAILESDATVPGGARTISFPLTFLAFTRAPIGDGFPHVDGRPTRHLTLFEQRLRAEP